MKLSGKIAIVTGTSPNIGGGIAEGLAEEGATVVCVDVASDNAAQCADWIKRRGGAALGVTCDVTDEAQVEAMVAQVRDAYGRVDVLVNNAGILGGLSVLEMPLPRWNRQIAVNLTGTFLCTKHVARCMVERATRGSIIVIVSTAGHQGQAGNIAYATSKSGLLNFTRAAAMDLARHGIRVNSLTPTATDPEEGIERAVAWGRPRPERRSGLLDFPKMVPMQKLPSPRHYARAAVFLASEDAEMVTGFDLRVDAGAIAKYWPWVPGA
ncbi:MAG TPA: SDR family NAD(P)-dependent oxidoreductase [Patescibacteria group bacterium]|nr:SDR family NAD(P)-dependent oxidoreductase [Patescibacteria group bacterium]